MHKIGYYVNNHGTGHTNRLFCFVQELETIGYKYELYVFAENTDKIFDLGLPNSNGNAIEVIKLPTPNWKLDKESTIYHCLPINYKEYFGAIVEVCIKESIQTFVSDLSVEVGHAVRLHVDKLVYVLLHGDRVDSPHTIMFEEADLLLVPFTSEFEDYYLRNFKERYNLKYSGGFLKFQYQDSIQSYPAEYLQNKKNVLVILGTGGDSFTEEYLDVEDPSYNIVVLGKEVDKYTSIRFTNPYSYLNHADIVVANAGDSIMHEIAYFDKPYICIPEDRPFHEQQIKAQQLEKYNYALISNWNLSLTKDLQRLKPQRNKETLIENAKAAQYTQSIINL